VELQQKVVNSLSWHIAKIGCRTCSLPPAKPRLSRGFPPAPEITLALSLNGYDAAGARSHTLEPQQPLPFFDAMEHFPLAQQVILPA
jgi:hypothetical protein